MPNYTHKQKVYFSKLDQSKSGSKNGVTLFRIT